MGIQYSAWRSELKPGELIDAILDFLAMHSGDYRGTVAKGYLASSDHRIGNLLSPDQRPEYEHSAMPLLDLRLVMPVSFIIWANGVRKKLVAGRIIAYHDSVWLMRSHKALREAEKFPYREIEKVTLSLPTREETTESDINTFLDRL